MFGGAEFEVDLGKAFKFFVRQLHQAVAHIGEGEPDGIAVTDVLVTGPDEVWVERRGTLTLTDVSFDDERHLLAVIARVRTAREIPT